MAFLFEEDYGQHVLAQLGKIRVRKKSTNPSILSLIVPILKERCMTYLLCKLHLKHFSWTLKSPRDRISYMLMSHASNQDAYKVLFTQSGVCESIAINSNMAMINYIVSKIKSLPFVFLWLLFNLIPWYSAFMSFIRSFSCYLSFCLPPLPLPSSLCSPLEEPWLSFLPFWCPTQIVSQGVSDVFLPKAFSKIFKRIKGIKNI